MIIIRGSSFRSSGGKQYFVGRPCKNSRWKKLKVLKWEAFMAICKAWWTYVARGPDPNNTESSVSPEGNLNVALCSLEMPKEPQGTKGLL